jgi:hypothetical protein
MLARVLEKMDTSQEMYANMKSNQEQILAKMEAHREEREAERKADQENLRSMMEQMMDVNQAARLEGADLSGLRWHIKKSLGKTPQRCRSENRRNGVGTEILTQGAEESRRNGPRARMGAGRIWLQPAEGRPVVHRWHGAGEFFHIGDDPGIL